ncbi:hypothetical protein SH139x_001451 [Planctomycetaceae bacterium SH139]
MPAPLPKDSPQNSTAVASESETKEASAAAGAKPLVIEPKIQWTLAIRTIIHWVACVTYFAVVLFFTQMLYDPEQSFWEHVRAYTFDALHWLPAILLLLPLVVYDTLRVSQRIVTPVLQVQAGLAELVQDQKSAQLEIAEENYFPELLSHFNQVRGMVGNAQPEELSDEEAEMELDALLA